MPVASGPVPERYLQAVALRGHVLDRLEAVLEERTGNEHLLNLATLRELAGRPTEDSLQVCLSALESLGILTREGQAFRINQKQLDVSAGYRRGIRDTLRLLASRSTPPVLLATVPPSLPMELNEVLRREAYDLRATILDIIVGARQELILASPFWDDETLDELTQLLGRRVSAGAKVHLLGRGKSDRESLLELKRRLPSIQCFAWYDPVQKPPMTFHFKAAVADRQIGYLGSANFTHSGFWSQLELGYRLEGNGALQLAKILEDIIRFAKPVA